MIDRRRQQIEEDAHAFFVGVKYAIQWLAAATFIGAIAIVALHSF